MTTQCEAGSRKGVLHTSKREPASLAKSGLLYASITGILEGALSVANIATDIASTTAATMKGTKNEPVMAWSLPPK